MASGTGGKYEKHNAGFRWDRKKEGRMEKKISRKKEMVRGSIVGYCVESPCCELW